MFALACGAEDDGAAHGPVVAHVDGVALPASVVAFIAERDGLDAATARERATQTLQLHAAARAEQRAASEPAPLVTEARRAQLLRAARARLWLDTDFEPAHGIDAIPDDDPLLQRARATGAWVHPRVHRVCQVIVIPRDAEGEAAKATAEDPTWREGAMALGEVLARRARLHVPVDDPEACRLLGNVTAMSKDADDPTYALRFEGELGFDLRACLRRADDGSCAEPQLDPEWTATIQTLQPPALSDPFATRFGVHVALVRAIEPARELGDPKTEQFLREQVHEMWRQRELMTYLERLQAEHAVRIASEAPEP